MVLPSLGSLNLLTTPGPALHCSQRFREHQRFHHDQYKRQSSSSSCSSISRSSRSPSPTSTSHSNVPYSLEQVHFIQYHREDKQMQWQAIVEPFKRQFPRVVFQESQSSGPKRNKGALECRYYRAQLYPKLDDEGNFILDQNGEEEMVNIRVRDRRNHHHKSVLENYIKLVTRCPERVVTYSWTDEEDKEKARRIIAARATQGIGPLPGAELRVRPTL
ncbi:hypothetical protein V493_06639 [Pseudogymnoascus sp. VKM F-4281 (FW-2241)]|nr:hypothetical protein V493_06639 [Pseudogymnoascus sp. VKM F-4281 (FW-2241)]